MGIPADVQPSCVYNGFLVAGLPGGMPDFGRFYGSHGCCEMLVAVLAKNLPHIFRSREHEFTDGRV
jgi:hypothetical protein